MSAASGDEGLQRTGRFAGGLIDDLKRRLPFYTDDFKQGFHSKVLGSTLFLYFACLANAIAFGALTGFLTEVQIGTTEMMIATAVGGIVFALFAGQPLTILGGTGPIVIFTALIAVIFIVEAITDISLGFNDPNTPYDAALLGLVLALGTFILARMLQGFRNSSYLRWWMRDFLADFGPAIAIVTMTIVAILMHEVPRNHAQVPEAFGTTTGRPWFVDMFSVPTWIWFAAIVPAVLAVAMLVPIRRALPRFFDREHLRALDEEEEAAVFEETGGGRLGP